jgi:hypothetical protein
MKNKLPLFLLFAIAAFTFIAYFSPDKTVQTLDDVVRNKYIKIIGTFAIILGLGSLVQYHINKIKRKAQYFRYSYVQLAFSLVSAIIGIFGGFKGDGILPTKIGSFSFSIQAMYTGIIVPLGSSMFALLAFYMSSAAYRAFRIRNFQAGVLLLSAFIVMLGQIPVGNYYLSFLHLDVIRQWILDYPNLAAKRGIMIGVALGTMATSLKIILGIERGWLGGTK